MLRCKNGHYYDQTKHSQCPYCGININLDFMSKNKKKNVDTEGKTVAKRQTPIKEEPKTVAKSNRMRNDEQKTMSLFRKNSKIDPVVGWLVCIDGPDRGRDYKIRKGRNFIGRNPKMDICLTDEMVSRDKHATIIYDPKFIEFYLEAANNITGVLLNNESITGVSKLIHRDEIIIGKSKFVFIPFCGEGYEW